MKRLSIHVALFISVLTLFGCSSTGGSGGAGRAPAGLEKPPSSIPYEKESLVLNIKSDPQLNLYQGGPHTLALCVYQLRDPNAFNQMAEERNGFSKLMDCERFDPTVLQSKRLSIQPASERQYLMDRAEGARYLGIVAGYYYPPSRERVLRLYQIPAPGWGKSKKLVIDLNLGQRQIN